MSSLYRGMSSPMAGVAAINAIVFGIYGQSLKIFGNHHDYGICLLAGAAAGMAQSPVSGPIELAKIRLQLQNPLSSSYLHSGPAQCLCHIYKHEGLRGVYKGLGLTVLREVPGYGVYFLTYEVLTKPYGNSISTPHMLIAGGLAGSASWLISCPVDVIKSRIQADLSGRYSGAYDCFRKSIQAEGYACLFRGLMSSIVRAFPTNAATFAVVTWTCRFFNEERNSSNHQHFHQSLVLPQETYVTQWNKDTRSLHLDYLSCKQGASYDDIRNINV